MSAVTLTTTNKAVTSNSASRLPNCYCFEMSGVRIHSNKRLVLCGKICKDGAPTHIRLSGVPMRRSRWADGETRGGGHANVIRYVGEKGVGDVAVKCFLEGCAEIGTREWSVHIAVSKAAGPGVVIETLGSATYGSQVFIAMESAWGDMCHYHDSLGDADDRPWKMCNVLISATKRLLTLHENGVAHGDFKPDNVLIKNDGSVVLSDLSFAAVKDVYCGAPGGTRCYLSSARTETGGQACPRDDIHALALMALMSFTGSPPDPVPLVKGVGGGVATTRRMVANSQFQRKNVNDPLYETERKNWLDWAKSRRRFPSQGSIIGVSQHSVAVRLVAGMERMSEALMDASVPHGPRPDNPKLLYEWFDPGIITGVGGVYLDTVGMRNL
jgi:hypothetical protein